MNKAPRKVEIDLIVVRASWQRLGRVCRARDGVAPILYPVIAALILLGWALSSLAVIQSAAVLGFVTGLSDSCLAALLWRWSARLEALEAAARAGEETDLNMPGVRREFAN